MGLACDWNGFAISPLNSSNSKEPVINYSFTKKKKKKGGYTKIRKSDP